MYIIHHIIIVTLARYVLSKKEGYSMNQSDELAVRKSPVVGDAVVVKFVETLMESEKYLKMIDSVDKKINHLDMSFHEKSNSILKYLGELIKIVKISSTDNLEKTLTSLKHDLDVVKQNIDLKYDVPASRTGNGDTPYAATDESSMDARLSSIESQVKTIMSGVESIVSIIAEVKHRQGQPRAYPNKADPKPFNMDMTSIMNEFRKSIYDQRVKKCGDCKQGRFDRSSERFPSDCFEIQQQGFNVSGIYKIKPEDMEPFYILCDLNTAGGGWTVFQNRFEGMQEFYKDWSDYKNGFGNLAGEFWLGLEKLHFLTNQKLYELRIDLETQHGHEAFAGYSVFTIGPEHEGFRISTLGTYFGTAGDSLSYHAGQKFSTYDVDNDEWKDGSCAQEHTGAWWYKECDKSNLNGRYASTGEEKRPSSMYWISFKGPNFPIIKTKMMIRPLPASRPADFDKPTRKIAEGPRVMSMPEPRVGNQEKMQEPVHRPYRYEDTINNEPFFQNYP